MGGRIHSVLPLGKDRSSDAVASSTLDIRKNRETPLCGPQVFPNLPAGCIAMDSQYIASTHD